MTSTIQSTARESRWDRVPFLLIGYLLVGAVLFAHLMMRPVEPNEHMYLAASVLAQHESLYRDFPFLQMPNLPLQYAVAYRISNVDHYLLVARVITWGWVWTSCLMIGVIIRRITDDRFAGFAAAVIMACGESFIIATGESSNYAPPITCMLMAHELLWRALRSETSTRSRGLLLSGLGISFAVGFKLYYALCMPAFLVAAWMVRPSASNVEARIAASRNKAALAVALGSLVGALPSIYYLLRDRDVFMFNNLYFHQLTSLWYQSIDYGDRVTWPQKLRYTKYWFQHPSQVWCVYGGFASLLAALKLRAEADKAASRYVRYECVFAWICVALLFAAALSPTPAWPQYYVAPLPMLLIAIVLTLNSRSAVSRIALACAALVGIWVSGPYYMRAVYHASSLREWVPIAFHNDARQLLGNVHTSGLVNGEGPLVLTQAPLVVLEGGGRIYPELAACNFLFQVADQLTDDQLKSYRAVSPKSLEALLAVRPPDAILTRVERAPPGNTPATDDLLDLYASTNGYSEKTSNRDWILWTKPEN